MENLVSSNKTGLPLVLHMPSIVSTTYIHNDFVKFLLTVKFSCVCTFLMKVTDRLLLLGIFILQPVRFHFLSHYFFFLGRYTRFASKNLNYKLDGMAVEVVEWAIETRFMMAVVVVIGYKQNVYIHNYKDVCLLSTIVLGFFYSSISYILPRK